MGKYGLDTVDRLVLPPFAGVTITPPPPAPAMDSDGAEEDDVTEEANIKDSVEVEVVVAVLPTIPPIPLAVVVVPAGPFVVMAPVHAAPCGQQATLPA